MYHLGVDDDVTHPAAPQEGECVRVEKHCKSLHGHLNDCEQRWLVKRELGDAVCEQHRLDMHDIHNLGGRPKTPAPGRAKGMRVGKFIVQRFSLAKVVHKTGRPRVCNCARRG